MMEEEEEKRAAVYITDEHLVKMRVTREWTYGKQQIRMMSVRCPYCRTVVLLRNGRKYKAEDVDYGGKCWIEPLFTPFVAEEPKGEHRWSRTFILEETTGTVYAPLLQFERGTPEEMLEEFSEDHGWYEVDWMKYPGRVYAHFPEGWSCDSWPETIPVPVKIKRLITQYRNTLAQIYHYERFEMPTCDQFPQTYAAILKVLGERTGINYVGVLVSSLVITVQVDDQFFEIHGSIEQLHNVEHEVRSRIDSVLGEE